MSSTTLNLKGKSLLLRNLESFSCVWLDGQLNKTDDNRETEEKLRQIINHLFTCNDQQICEEYIRNINQEKIVFIVSGAMGKDLIPRIHDLSQLSAIYVFCGKIHIHKQWATKYSKVKGVFDNIDNLIENLSEDQTFRSKFEESASISVINQNCQSVEEQNTNYMWFQLYIEVLIRMHHKLTDRKELIDLCKESYKDNQTQLKILNEFEKNYKSENAIWWYTRESCLYRILNKALRSKDYDTLFAFRFFLTDISKQLKFEYEKFIRNNDNRGLISVYRGQLIKNNEIQLMKNSIGQYLSMNSFFSTSAERATALEFIQQLTIIDDQHEKILFVIEIDPKLQTKPFVNVKPMSFYKSEDEILIMFGAFFFIKKISFDQQSQFWIAHLSLADENDYRLKDTFTHMKQKIGEETNLASLGKILFEMGLYDQVEKCYQHMLYDTQLDLSTAHSGLGKAALGKKDFTKAAQCEEKSLQIKQSILPENHRELAISYSRLGHIYSQQNDHKQALKYLKKAGKIQQNFSSSDPLTLGKTYQRLATTCMALDDHQLAMEFYDKTLQIRKEYLPPFDKSIASTYHRMGELFQKQNQYTQASNYYNQALEIYKKVLPPKHPNINQIEQDIQNLQKQTKK